MVKNFMQFPSEGFSIANVISVRDLIDLIMELPLDSTKFQKSYVSIIDWIGYTLTIQLYVFNSVGAWSGCNCSGDFAVRCS